uniref:ST8 alpha-N-acetyl-neuraminide alpha-2,8-sialyltransferase 6 n=1 Tax=Gadus morhua TaxID=8049 RepID=A0A8C5AT10_GADMO
MLCCSYIPFTLQPTVKCSALYPLYTPAYSALNTNNTEPSVRLSGEIGIKFNHRPLTNHKGQHIIFRGHTELNFGCKCAYFPFKNPFSSKPWDTCSVVGNGGILSNSTCGEMIDSAQFVIRCNLPPVESSHLKDVGKKTGLVTANPSILNQNGLLDRRRPFVDSMSHYKDALILLPAFTLSKNIQPSLRVVYTIEESLSPIRPVFLNPEYIRNLHSFWSSKGLNKRLSSGFMVASLALELCTNVHLYGFWPFDQHPLLQQPLNNHYYDNIQSKKKVHAMPDEFDHLLRLHEQGVLKIHLGECV